MWMTILCQVILGEIIYVLQDENHIVKDCQGLVSFYFEAGESLWHFDLLAPKDWNYFAFQSLDYERIAYTSEGSSRNAPAHNIIYIF